MYVRCDCGVLSGRGLWAGLITRPESPTKCGVCEGDGYASIRGSPGPVGAVGQ